MSDPAPHRLVDEAFGPWMAKAPYSPEEKAMAPGWADREAEEERLRQEEPDLLKRRSPAPLQLDEVVYENNHTREVLPYAELVRRGPVRPVIGPPEADVARLQELIRAAGRNALGTLAAALYAVEQRLEAEEPPRMPTSGLVSPGSLVRRDPLTAGRPGSWEASDLIDFTWEVGPSVDGDELDEELYREAIEIFHRWATDPAGYVEFAETIPEVLAPIVDEGDGVGAVAADWLLLIERTRMWAGSKSMNHAGY
jgi:hypothetical protein